MVPAALLSWLLCRALKIPIRWHRQALLSYLAAGLGMFFTMMMAYWASQYVESGMLSVIFGITPILSGLLSVWILREPLISRGKMFALLVALAGFVLIFRGEMGMKGPGIWAIAVLIVAVWIFSLSAVLIKKIDYGGHPLTQSSGALIVTSPIFLALFLATGTDAVRDASLRSLVSIGYLIVFGSILGFVAYFYVLKRMSPRDVGIINLLAPIFALWLGATVNSEQLGILQFSGAALVLISLALYQWGSMLFGATPVPRSTNNRNPESKNHRRINE